MWQRDHIEVDPAVIPRVVRLARDLPANPCESGSGSRITDNSILATRWPLKDALSYAHDVRRTRVLAPPRIGRRGLLRCLYMANR